MDLLKKIPSDLWKPIGTALLVLFAVLGWLREPDPPENPWAEAQTEELIRQLSEDGWSVMRAEAVGDLTRAMIEAGDSADARSLQLAAAARQAALLGGEVRSLAQLLSEARDSLALPAKRDTVYLNGEMRERATTEYEDDVFSARIAYLFEPVDSFSVALEARINAVLTQTEGPDGTILFSATSDDSRVFVGLERAVWSPPPPVQFCSWRTRGTWASIGGAAGFVGGVLLRR